MSMNRIIERLLNMKKLVLFLALAVFVTTSVAISSSAEAKGRKGSHRVGGKNSKGKGSHYRGGRK